MTITSAKTERHKNALDNGRRMHKNKQWRRSGPPEPEYPPHVQRAIDSAEGRKYLKTVSEANDYFYGQLPAKAKARVVEPKYDSKWEEEFAEGLELRKRAGEILDWGHHDIRLNLGEGAWYKPDFWVITDKSEIVLIEVKGFWREAAKVRFKVARSKFPWLKFEAWTKESGQWEETLREKSNE